MALGLTPQQIVEKGTHSLLEISSDWGRIELQEIASVQNGYAFKSKFFSREKGVPLIRIRDINRVETDNLYTGEYSDDFVVHKDDILIGMDGDFNVTRWPGKRGLLNQRVCRIKMTSAKYDEGFLFYVLQPYLNAVHAETSAVTVKHLSSKTIKSLPIPNPSLPEQRAIVAKLEVLLGALDRSVGELEVARGKLGVYRASVLKEAFWGRLTAGWREENEVDSHFEILDKIEVSKQEWLEQEIENGNAEAKRVKNKLRKRNRVEKTEGVPLGWVKTSLIDACQLVVDCHNKTAPYEENGIYLVRTSNIRDGKLNLVDKMKFISEETYEYWSRRCPPKSGDIIFTREAPAGEAAIIPANTKICLGQRTMLFRVDEDHISVKYLLYAILSPGFQQSISEGSIGTGVKHLRVGDVESLEFPLCSLPEQHQIVAEIESRLSVADGLEREIEGALDRVKGLRMGVLRRAFKGELLTEEELKLIPNESE